MSIYIDIKLGRVSPILIPKITYKQTDKSHELQSTCCRVLRASYTSRLLGSNAISQLHEPAVVLSAVPFFSQELIQHGNCT